jgi:transcriptional regulator with XRE-family HTH domain
MTDTTSTRARERIRLEMHRLKLNQADLANQINWTQSKVSKVLNGDTELAVEDLDALCFAVNLRITEAVRDHGMEFCAELTPTELRIVEGLRHRGPDVVAAILKLLFLKAPEAPQAMPLKKKTRKLSAKAVLG